MRSYLQKELIWGDGLNAVWLGGVEIGEIEGDDIGRTRSQGRLENHVILRIGEKRPPKEVNSLVDAKLANAVENRADLGGGKANPDGRSKQNIFVFRDERHGKDGLEMPCIHAKKEFMTGASGRFEGGHDHIGVEDCPNHVGIVNATAGGVNV